MLTKLTIRNFKRFDEAVIELADPVVLIGPNNSGKTTALQALTLWDAGLRTWLDKRGGSGTGPKVRSGVSINRKDLFNLPLPSALLLWRGLHVREKARSGEKNGTENVRIEIVAEGISRGKPWVCGLEFDYGNEESIYCRPLRTPADEPGTVPAELTAESLKRIAYLPPMSGLADREFIKQAGEISFLIGQGQTAQVLRNLCFGLQQRDDGAAVWGSITQHLKKLFGIELQPPALNAVRSELTLTYRDPGSDRDYDLSCAGRGVQQTLLLLAFLYGNPGSILLLDEPDAHLEILRQRQVFTLLTEVAAAQQAQIIAASHSEVVLNEAASRGRVVAFVGRPHTLNDRGDQALKALTELGFEQYYQAEQKGWVLYLEAATDLDILRSFAEILGHPTRAHLESPFFHPVTTNLPQRARDHFFGICEAKPDLVGIAIFDRLDKQLQDHPALKEMMWRRRAIENYFCTREVLLAYAGSDTAEDLFGVAERDRRIKAMEDAIAETTAALQTLGKPDPWSAEIKASDDFIEPLFKNFSEKLGVPLVLRKNEYYKLARFVKREQLDPEVTEKLDAIGRIATAARPE